MRFLVRVSGNICVVVVLVSVRHEPVLVKDRDKVLVRLSTMKGNQCKFLISIDEQMC